MKQFIKFSVVGVSNTVVTYVVYIICLRIFQKFESLPRNDYIASSVIAFFLSVLWAFYWNRRFTFKEERGAKGAGIWGLLFKTYVSYALTGLVINNLLLVLWVQVLGLSKSIAPLISICATTPLNFFLNKRWAYGKHVKEKDKPIK